MSFTEKSAMSRIIVLILLILLILYYVWSHFSVGKDVIFRISVSIFPLVIFLPGILARRYRSASLLCFVLLLYFMVGVQSLFTPGDALSESFAMVVIVVLFSVSMFYSRWQQRADVLESGNDATNN